MSYGFHLRDGLYFKRDQNGFVRLTKTRNAHSSEVDYATAITPEEWASIVAFVSLRGETANWANALAFHNGQDRQPPEGTRSE